jgi:hypothetical protein
MQNDPQDEIPIKKAWRTWRALREIKKVFLPNAFRILNE